MNENEARKQLTVFDALLDDLATAATDSQTSPQQLIALIGKVVNSIIGPEFFAIIAAGPRRSLLPINFDDESSPDIADWVEPAPGNIDAPILNLQPKGRNVYVARSSWESGPGAGP